METIAKEQGRNFTWDPSGDLYLWQNRPAFIHHPVTRKKTWFNQATTHHCSYYRTSQGDKIPDNKYPGHSFYGDGSDIEPAVIQHLLATAWSCAVGFKWRKGDLLVLDNLSVLHGRLGFEGDRKILLYMIK